MLLFGSLSSIILSYIFNNFQIILFIFILFSLWQKYKFNVVPSIYHYKEQSADVIIIGCGVLGSIMATVLGWKNYKVIVIERNLKQPVRIIGELLQPGGVEALKKLKLEGALDGIDAQSSYGYIVYHNELGTNVKLPYNHNKECFNYHNSGVKSQLDGITNFIGKSFHHGRFIQNLRRFSDDLPNVQKIEGEAVKLLWDENKSQKGDRNLRVVGVQYREKSTGTIKEVTAPLTFVLDGCFSKFRKFLFPPGKISTPQIESYFLGLLIPNPEYIDDVDDRNQQPSSESEEQTFAQVVLATDPVSVILIYKISTYYTRVLIDIPCPLPKNIKEFLKYEITPQLPARYRDSFLLALAHNEGKDAFLCNVGNSGASASIPNISPTNEIEDLTSSDQATAAVTTTSKKSKSPYFETALVGEDDVEPEAFTMKIMPNSYLVCPASAKALPLGVITLGDALNMRHPLTGGGMTVGMNDAIFWLDWMEELKTTGKDLYDDAWFLEGRKNFAYQRSLNYSFAVNVLAQALYHLYASGSDEHLKEMREACFHYFEMGGVCVTGPMSLLSITQPKPHLLIRHFFAVALYAVYRKLKKSRHNVIAGATDSCLLLYKACKIIFPLIWNEFNALAYKRFA